MRVFLMVVGALFFCIAGCSIGRKENKRMEKDDWFGFVFYLILGAACLYFAY